MSGIGLAKKGAGKAYQAFKKLEKKADKVSEKMIKEMNSPKLKDKIKGYLKLGGLTAGTAAVMPSTVNKDKKNKGKKEKRVFKPLKMLKK